MAKRHHVDIEIGTKSVSGTQTVKKTNIFGGTYWDVESIEVFGYEIWESGFVIHSCFGFDDEDDAYDGAADYLDGIYGTNGWDC